MSFKPPSARMRLIKRKAAVEFEKRIRDDGTNSVPEYGMTLRKDQLLKLASDAGLDLDGKLTKAQIILTLDSVYHA